MTVTRYTVELVELTDQDNAAARQLAEMRRRGHQSGCQCVPCIDVRRHWRGDLDELERLAEELAAGATRTKRIMPKERYEELSRLFAAHAASLPPDHRRLELVYLGECLIVERDEKTGEIVVSTRDPKA